MPIHLTPLDNNFAFEVQGLDLWSGLDDRQVRTLDDAWANQGVLVFRRQVAFGGGAGHLQQPFRHTRRHRPYRLGVQVSSRGHADLKYAQRRWTYDRWARVGRTQLAHRSILRGSAGDGRHPLWRRGAGGRAAHLLGQPAARLRSTPARDQGADRRPARYLQLRQNGTRTTKTRPCPAKKSWRRRLTYPTRWCTPIRHPAPARFIWTRRPWSASKA